MSFVYAAAAENLPGILKIGHAKNPRTRMYALRNTYTADTDPGRVRMVFAHDCGDRAWRIEQITHALLQHRHDAYEWFRVSPQEARWAIMAAQVELRRNSAPRRKLREISLPWRESLGTFIIEYDWMVQGIAKQIHDGLVPSFEDYAALATVTKREILADAMAPERHVSIAKSKRRVRPSPTP